MQSDLIDDVETERSEMRASGSSATEHPADQVAFAPSEPARNPPTSEPEGGEPAAGMSPSASGYAPATMRTDRSLFRTPWSYLLIPLILLLVLAAGVGGGMIGARLASAPSVTPATLQQQVESASLNAQPSVVQVRSRGVSSGALGSGVILTKDGYIATNDHVVNGFRTYTVLLFNGQSLTAQVVGEDAQNDLAVLKVAAGDLTPITFADPSALKVGQFVVALGSPLGLDDSATFGVVSALNRTVTESSDSTAATREYTGMIQTDMTLNPGNSGGALIDLQGRLIGIPNLRAESTSTGVDVDGIGFAIPADRVKSVTTRLIQEWTPKQ